MYPRPPTRPLLLVADVAPAVAVYVVVLDVLGLGDAGGLGGACGALSMMDDHVGDWSGHGCPAGGSAAPPPGLGEDGGAAWDKIIIIKNLPASNVTYTQRCKCCGGAGRLHRDLQNPLHPLERS